MSGTSQEGEKMYEGLAKDFSDLVDGHSDVTANRDTFDNYGEGVYTGYPSALLAGAPVDSVRFQSTQGVDADGLFTGYRLRTATLEGHRGDELFFLMHDSDPEVADEPFQVCRYGSPNPTPAPPELIRAFIEEFRHYEASGQLRWLSPADRWLRQLQLARSANEPD